YSPLIPLNLIDLTARADYVLIIASRKPTLPYTRISDYGCRLLRRFSVFVVMNSNNLGEGLCDGNKMNTLFMYIGDGKKRCVFVIDGWVLEIALKDYWKQYGQEQVYVVSRYHRSRRKVELDGIMKEILEQREDHQQTKSHEHRFPENVGSFDMLEQLSKKDAIPSSWNDWKGALAINFKSEGNYKFMTGARMLLMKHGVTDPVSTALEVTVSVKLHSSLSQIQKGTKSPIRNLGLHLKGKIRFLNLHSKKNSCQMFLALKLASPL
ncbi:hypothetical protein M8C21_005710, partial [Ambrosia artemisiifolia]